MDDPELQQSFLFFEPAIEDEEPRRWVSWLRDHWIVDVEAWVEGDALGEDPIEDEHRLFLLRQFDIPDGLIPLEALDTMPPRLLRHLAQCGDELVSADQFRSFRSALKARGVEIVGYLGAGGWGHVFKAKTNDGRIAAIKVLKPPYSDEWRDRFTREADTLSRLASSPGIPEIYEGVTEVEQLQFIVTEFIAGAPLSEYRLPIDVQPALFIVAEILMILDVVHREGVIHRDLHLGNVMEKPSSQLVLLDFGLARDEEAEQYYRTFKPVGAMSHCAPEKWQDPSGAGPPSDIFSVGVMLYRLVTGRSPFWADTYIGLYEQIKAGDYRLPSDVVGSLDGTPTHLESLEWSLLNEVAMRMLDPSLDNRFSGCGPAIEYLKHVLAILPTD